MRGTQVKPVDQTTFGSPGGNCFSACVASILELDIAEVPYFMGVEDWWPPFVEWCVARGINPVFHDRREGSATEHDPAPRGWSIVTGQSPRYEAGHYHSIVAHDGMIVHDPRADDRRGLQRPIIDYITLEKL